MIVLTLEQIAKQLKVSRNTAYKLAQAGKLPVVKIGGGWRGTKEALEQWFRAHAVRGIPPAKASRQTRGRRPVTDGRPRRALALKEASDRR